MIKIITVKVSELLKMAQELSNDGIEYVELEEYEADEESPQSLSFTGYGGYGNGLDYENIDHIEVSWDYKSEEESDESQ